MADESQYGPNVTLEGAGTEAGPEQRGPELRRDGDSGAVQNDNASDQGTRNSSGERVMSPFERAQNNTTQTAGSSVPNQLIANWKTSVGFSILGIVAYMVLFEILVFIFALVLEASGVPAPNGIRGAQAGSIVAFVYAIAVIAYVQVFQKACFKEKPPSTSSKAVSFWNFFFGGVIFGALWNYRLTQCRRGQKAGCGSSGTVLQVICAIGLVASANSMYMNIAVYAYYPTIVRL